MITDTGYIPEEIAQKIKNAAVMKDIIAEEVDLKKSGSAWIGDCPCCGAKKRLQLSRNPANTSRAL